MVLFMSESLNSVWGRTVHFAKFPILKENPYIWKICKKADPKVLWEV